MPIKNLGLSILPREKALSYGMASLNEFELLALLLKTGVKDLDVIELSYKLIRKYSSLSKLIMTNYEDLLSNKGLGKVKALQLLCIQEVIKKVNLEQTKNHGEFYIDKAFEIAFSLISNFKSEHFIVVLPPKADSPIYSEVLYKGTTDQIVTDPKDIISLILKKGAKEFYCFHNHPSGDIKPSKADIMTTNMLRHYCKIFRLNLKGHYIFNANKNYQEIIW